jgi:hypothetical protein
MNFWLLYLTRKKLWGTFYANRSGMKLTPWRRGTFHPPQGSADKEVLRLL